MEAIDLKKLRKNLFGLSTTKVSRSLFGETDHEEVKKDLEREYKDLLQEKSKLWNFDFDKYEPREEKQQQQSGDSNLTWIPYISSTTVHSIEKNKSLITSTSQDFTTVEYCPRMTSTNFNKRENRRNYTTTTSTKQQQHSLPPPLPKKIEGDTTSSSTRNNKNPVLIATDDENVIQIINESPIRNIINPVKDMSPVEQSKAKLDITKTLSRKRKRGSQPTIDGTFSFFFLDHTQ